MKRSVFNSFMIMGMIFAFSPMKQDVFASSGYGGGSGTESDPYLISTPEHLIYFNEEVTIKKIDTTGVYYQLTDDIDFSGYDTDSDDTNGNFSPIGYSKSFGDRNYFKGTFDGNGHTISNIEIILPNQDYVGFFGYIDSATIQNLGLENIRVEGSGYVGGLVGHHYKGSVAQSYATGSVKGNRDCIGGLAGYSSGTITQSYATGEVSGHANVGGLLGYQSSGTVDESYSTGKVTGRGAHIGGLVGYAGNTLNTTHSYWDVESSGRSSSYFGGIPILTRGLTSELAYEALEGFDFDGTWVLCQGERLRLQWEVSTCEKVQRRNFPLEGDGSERSPYLIKTEDQLIEVNRLINTGGSLAFKYYSLAADLNLLAYDTDNDETNGNWTPLGTLFIPFKGTFDGNGHAISNIEIMLPNQDYVGFFGYTDSATIQNLGLVDVVVSGNRYVGGLVGNQRYETITQSYATGTVMGSNNVGGLVGWQYYGDIAQSYATGEVSGGSYVGGLVGDQDSGMITQSYATGEVSGTTYVGGLAGRQYSGSITESYATGTVMGSNNVGGLVGYQTSSGTVTQSYSTGAVSGINYVGGLVGDQDSGTVTQSYSTGEVNGTKYVGGLVGRQTVHSKVSESYSTGKVDGTSYVGGLVGSANSPSNTTHSYWDVETSGQKSNAGGGGGLTTDQMTKRNAKTNMNGFDFDTIWQESNGYPLLHWQTPDPIMDRELMIDGTIEATIVSLTIPSNSITFVLNPNEEEEQQFIASEFSLINESRIPLVLELRAFEQVTAVLNDVVPTKYNDWNSLNKKESKDFALALVPKTGDGWLTLNEGDRWVAELGDSQIGVMKGNSTVSFGFEAKHGSAFSETLTPQYCLTFVFGLQD